MKHLLLSEPTVTGDLRPVGAEVHRSIHEAEAGPPMEHVQVHGETSLQDLRHNSQHVCKPYENNECA